MKMVRAGGLEPPRPKAQDPKSCVSANSTTLAFSYTVYEEQAGVVEKSLTFCCGGFQANAPGDEIAVDQRNGGVHDDDREGNTLGITGKEADHEGQRPATDSKHQHAARRQRRGR